MHAAAISITDWMRILKGTTPWIFLLEIGFRVLFLYGLIIVSMRLMGKRMGAQLTRNEMAALVSLAATVGIPMQTPDRGLLPALLVAVVVIGIQRLIAWNAFRNELFEQLAMDDIDVLVKDGCLQMKTLRKNALSREIVVAQLRSEGIDHLGKVQRLYLESSGAFTVKQFSEPSAGLTLFPKFDTEILRRQHKVDNCSACGTCGYLVQAAHPEGRCSRCGSVDWTEAVVS
jgi:uncharacterized membrane protein YcaP (DUF421 family)